MREIKFRAWDVDKKRMVLWDELKEDWGTAFLFYPNEVIPMQFTGLLDRNSKEIWEGDILHYYVDSEKKYLWTVEFQDGCFSLRREFRGGKPRCFCDDISGFEVIGDIYSNPELIGGK